MRPVTKSTPGSDSVTLQLGLWALVFVGAACLIAGFAHGAIGFGFPLVATPLVALVIDIKLAIGLLAPVTLVLVVITALQGGGLIAVARRFWYLPVAVGIGSWLGTRLLLAAPAEPFLLVLALVMILYLNLERVGRGSNPVVQRWAFAYGLAFGFVAGIFEAVANVAGPVLLVYFMLLGLSPLDLIQALNLCFSFGKTVQVATWAHSGAIAPADWLAIAALCIPSVGALFAGMRVRSRIDAQTYRSWLRKALAVMAALLIGQFATRTALAADEPIFSAIAQGKELAALGMVMRGGADVGARDAEGETPLHRAVEKGMKELAERLVAAGASLRARTRNGETVLHVAALHSDPWFADLLLKRGADVLARNDDGESPLFWAALSGNAVVAQHLLDEGADANVTDLKGNLPLHAAAHGGYLELVRMLLPRTRDRAAANREGKSALHYAREVGEDEVAKTLEGAD